MIQSNTSDSIHISTDKKLLNTTYIHQFLTHSYWTPGISYAKVLKKIKHSYCYGIYKDSVQIGFARVVTDFTAFAYLADVFIDEDHRGQGYSKQLIAFILKHPDFRTIDRFMLATFDAHTLYQKFKFKTMDNPEIFMYKLGNS